MIQTLFISLGLILTNILSLNPPSQVDAATAYEALASGLLTIQENSLLASATLPPEPKVVRTVKMMATAYSSTPEETDDTPFITAAGTTVRDGIVANNLLPFGTKIRMPDVYGDKIFVVEDRMNKRKGNYHVDVWFPSHREAEIFGAKLLNVEILEL